MINGAKDCRNHGSLDFNGTEDGIDDSFNLHGINKGNFNGLLDLDGTANGRTARLTPMAQRMALTRACLTLMAQRMALTTAYLTCMTLTKATSMAR
jgi:hypothetical protein